MRSLALVLLALVCVPAPSLGAQARTPRPASATASRVRQADADARVAAARVAAARVAAAREAAARLDSARVRADWAAAEPYLCSDTRAVPTRGASLGRDSILAQIARGTLMYALAPVRDGAILSWSPDDSTVVFDGRGRVSPAGAGMDGPTFWVMREFRFRAGGWCQLASRVRDT